MNNDTLEQQGYNTVGTPLLNIAPLDYEDGFSTPANRPQNPRLISNLISHQDGDEFLPESRGLSNMVWAFGQFIDHDVSLTPEISFPPNSPPDTSLYIPVPSGDPWLDPQNTGTVLIPIHDSAYIEGTGTNADNPRQLPNEITGWLDLSSVYGSDSERNEALRSFTGGKLKVSEGDLLALNYDLLPNDNPTRKDPSTLFLAGDVRANENTALLSLHTLFFREHNRIAENLAQQNPHWDDETLYQKARELNIAQYQAIIYEEYLPALFGEDSIPEYQGYNSEVDPSITRTFSTAAFRFGHTMLSSEIPLISIEGNQEESLQLAELFFNSAELLRGIGIDSLLRGLSYSSSQELDNKLINDVRNLLFGFGENALGRDLAALNIQRGRINGLADYNTIRQAYGLTAVKSFAEITSNIELQNQLATIYGTVDNIDPWVGFLAEDHLPSMSMGESLYTIIMDQFQRLREGDPFYYENLSFNQDFNLDDISETTLGELIVSNTDTKTIAESVFFIGAGNDKIKGDESDDVLYGFAGDDKLQGKEGNDVLYGGEGDDELQGDEGDDVLYGGEGKDKIKGCKGNDYLFGDAGDDKLEGKDGDDTLSGGEGEDELKGGKNNDELFGNAGDDKLKGEDGDDSLTGGAGNDLLEGGKGIDILTGTDPTSLGVGEIDELKGGDQGDLFVLGDSSQVYYDDGNIMSAGLNDYALIDDFNVSKGDKIQLHHLPEDYHLGSSPSGLPSGTAIFYISGQTEAELIAIVKGVQTLDLNDRKVFQYN